MLTSTRLRSRNESYRGFTLLELLVVISIVALLVSILLPSLKEARRQAKTVVCASHLKGMGTGLQTYLSEYADWIPGVNTSGVGLRANMQNPEALQTDFMPVQQFDWMTPIRTGTALPWKRAERFHFLLSEMKCPSLMDVPSVAASYGPSPDDDDFDNIELWPMTSYLMPVSFQYWGDLDAGKSLAKVRGPMSFKRVRALAAPKAYQTVRSERYISRIDRVGNPSEKLFVSDGTRFLDDKNLLDFDYFPWPQHFGAFGTSGAFWRGSTAYGVKAYTAIWGDDGPVPGVSVNSGTESLAEGKNLQLTYRHGERGVTISGDATKNPGSINALFYDGHVNLLSDRLSRRVEYWYPRGAVVLKPEDGMETVDKGHIVR